MPARSLFQAHGDRAVEPDAGAPGEHDGRARGRGDSDADAEAHPQRRRREHLRCDEFCFITYSSTDELSDARLRLYG